jgi:ABC-type transport system involved in cytochrome c biogenesis ATPase subunit
MVVHAARRSLAGDRAAGDARARPLYGRDRGLGVLTDLSDRLREGAGGALLVRGAAGIGKSSLLAAVAGRAADHGVEEFLHENRELFR